MNMNGGLLHFNSFQRLGEKAFASFRIWILVTTQPCHPFLCKIPTMISGTSEYLRNTWELVIFSLRFLNCERNLCQPGRKEKNMRESEQS